jgi:hypothetical protein
MQDRAPPLQEEFARLRDALGRRFIFGADRRALRVRAALAALEGYLCRPLRVAVLGEQNAGKSSLINLLLRESVVPTSALVGVRAHLLLRHGAEPGLYAVAGDGVRARLTSRALVRMAAPDVRSTGPATASPNAPAGAQPAKSEAPRGPAPLPDHLRPAADSAARLIEIVTPHDFLRRAELVETRLVPAEAPKAMLRHALPIDLAVWCTLATQAWKETERKAWERLPERLRKGAILLVTYKDAVASAKDEARLMARLERDAGPFFGSILPISLRQAGEVIGQIPALAERGKWERSGAAAFEQLLLRRLGALDHERRARSITLLRRYGRVVTANGGASPPTSREIEEFANQVDALIEQIKRMGG